MNQLPHTWEFRWPLPTADLQAVDVVELRWDASGQVLWRRDVQVPLLAARADDDLPRLELRLSLVDMDPDRMAPPRVPPGRFLGTMERLSLLGAGTLMGVVLAMTGLPRLAEPERASPSAAASATAGAGVASQASAAPEAPLPRVEPHPEAGPPIPPATTVTPPAPGHRVVLRAARQTPAAARPVFPEETPALLGTIQRYATAYSRLDAQAAQAVWPSADRQDLVATFTAIREQRLTLSRCASLVQGDAAEVTCRGTLRYRPRVGDHSTRVQQGPWRFGLTRTSDGWDIATVTRP